MKTRVFVLIPFDVPADQISEHCQRLLQPHRMQEDDPEPRGHYDYLVGALDEGFNDATTESRLPPHIQREFAGNICEATRLPPDADCGALITADGCWHDLSDFGWRMVRQSDKENLAALAAWQRHYRALLKGHPNCWVVAIWVHS
ncbi:MAG TPA: hypothetical protein VFG20_03925 [Planctomycetaceae bacterium]|nr:hypothetical protein [Planctomycetaceae bacterium]